MLTTKIYIIYTSIIYQNLHYLTSSYLPKPQHNQLFAGGAAAAL